MYAISETCVVEPQFIFIMQTKFRAHPAKVFPFRRKFAGTRQALLRNTFLRTSQAPLLLVSYHVSVIFS